ncbi:amino acid ABC transporter ATP-binding protein [Pelagicoccus albus]|uniref:Amino acid ABC transporter ATP-binding protein n=1 Tax=Pelagicoccus albus TaxID=415222 RepID=A0A7X1B431_9BACT|nr:amino acid ABC transporter ATP-binding protein [Pelagicoccus albus]MBC2605279.1 amino acid ABC transporter ATP-binding protein [Pelagicoccus albus]
MKLELKAVKKSYGEHLALKGVSLSLDQTKCLTLIGPSGGGKSTTLRMIAGLETFDSGQIAIDGYPIPSEERDLRAYRKTIGVVFQSYNLFPHLDAITNITLPLEKVHGFSKDEAIEQANTLLARFRLEDHGKKQPSELSGGQNQRVAIARALAHDPKLILFDEPTSALDPEMSAEILDVIEELIDLGKECVIVTHQMGFAKRASEHVAFLAQGQVAEIGSSSQIFDDPRSPELKRFLERELKY